MRLFPFLGTSNTVDEAESWETFRLVPLCWGVIDEADEWFPSMEKSSLIFDDRVRGGGCGGGVRIRSSN